MKGPDPRVVRDILGDMILISGVLIPGDMSPWSGSVNAWASSPLLAAGVFRLRFFITPTIPAFLGVSLAFSGGGSHFWIWGEMLSQGTGAVDTSVPAGIDPVKRECGWREGAPLAINIFS